MYLNLIQLFEYLFFLKTYLGDILVAVNPFNETNLYTSKVINILNIYFLNII